MLLGLIRPRWRLGSGNGRCIQDKIVVVGRRVLAQSEVVTIHQFIQLFHDIEQVLGVVVYANSHTGALGVDEARCAFQCSGLKSFDVKLQQRQFFKFVV